jgi:hypothetical protein
MVRLASGLVVGLLIATSAAAAPQVRVIRTDLEALIRAASTSQVQFAVHIPHAASLSDSGSWSEADGQSIWRYGVRVPTAVSMSFHATGVSLPSGAVLTVRSAKTTTSYTVRDLRRPELWSRVQPGDGLEFTLRVPTTERAAASLRIDSVQAGYRSIGAGVKDHPYYRRLSMKQSTSGSASCVQNYECSVTTANTPPAQATVGLIIGNLYQCSGTLINDVPGDGTAYILTARHCETGQLGGGNPGAASTVLVYWDATTTCGTALGSLYDPGVPMQHGATTVVEQQDAWLIKLNYSPVVTDAQLAGFDASGGTVQGGYTIHHALGYDKQYTTWFGQAASVQMSDVLGSSYISDFLETVNQTGNTGPGASGSALFDQNNHLVGSLTLGRRDGDNTGYESCPVSNPSPPNGSNGSNDFTPLAALWKSTADTSSTTGSVTLQSILDPNDTGTLVVANISAPTLTFTASTYNAVNGTAIQLTWSAPNATACTAEGGVVGDGWSGALAASGSQSVSETAANSVGYFLRCAYAGGRTAEAAVTVSWLGPSPILQFNAPNQVWTTAPATLTWNSNVGPCSINGGSLSLSNLPTSGSTSTTQATTGLVDYVLTCGPPNQSDSYPVTVQYVTPSLVFQANGTDRALGQVFFLLWSTAATSCTPSGGAPNDGWTNTAFTGFRASSPQPVNPTVTTPGTYTYTLTCSAGSASVQQSVTVTFENNAPYVTMIPSTSTVTFSGSPADWITVNWITNQSGCGIASVPNAYIQESYGPITDPAQGTLTFSPPQSGSYQLTAYCYASLASGPPPSVISAPLTLTVLPPAPPTASLSIVPTTVAAGQPFTITWSSTNTTGCSGNGTVPADVTWSAFGETSSTYTTSTNDPGQYAFGLSCPSIDASQANATAQASLTVTAFSPPTATLSADKSSYTVGQTIALTWSSTNATACTASGGGANGWTGAVATSGTATQTPTTTGTFTYTITCTEGSQSVQAQATVTVSAAATSPGGTGSSGGGGGGGAMDIRSLAVLALLAAIRRRPPKPYLVR